MYTIFIQLIRDTQFPDISVTVGARIEVNFTNLLAYLAHHDGDQDVM